MPSYPGFTGGRKLGSVIGSNPADDERRMLEDQKRKQERAAIGSAALSTIPIIGGLLGGIGGLFGGQEAEKAGPNAPGNLNQNTVLMDPYFDPYIQARYYRTPATRAYPLSPQRTAR